MSSARLTDTFNRRTFVLGSAMGGIGVLLAMRLGYLSIAQNEKYKAASESNRVNLTLIPPRRGWILDRNGAALASNRADFRVDLIPDRVVDADKRWPRSSLLDLSPDKVGDIHDKLDKSRGSSRSKLPPISTGTNSPPSACACPNCRAWCRSAAIRASIPPARPWGIWSAMSARLPPRTTSANATRC
jgi:cell division protein FtsI/penicillin-binding protein 2